MSTFDSWLEGRPPTDAEAAELLQAKSALGAAWPAGSQGWTAYATAIAASSAVADKGHALASLERAWRRFLPAVDGRTFWQTIAGWVSNVYFWAVLLGGGIIFLFFSHALDKDMLDRLARPEQARGLITFLFAVATVGIALVIVLAVFLSTGAKDEVSERFAMGKDVLAVLMGVFGTILGFYFGSEIASVRQPPAQQVSAPATNN